jgi:hypothetical protein
MPGSGDHERDGGRGGGEPGSGGHEPTVARCPGGAESFLQGREEGGDAAAEEES